MNVAQIPLTTYLESYKDAARECGYMWIVCIICRASDCKGLYKSIERDWQSLNSITGRSMLVLLAGNELDESRIKKEDKEYLASCCITDKKMPFVKRYYPYISFIGNEQDICTDLTSKNVMCTDYSVVQTDPEMFVKYIENNQTDAVDSLRRYFGIEEEDVPCLVYTPVYRKESPINNIIVRLPSGDADLYGYFKKLFNRISPALDEIMPFRNDFEKEIDEVYSKLLKCAEDSKLKEELVNNINIKKNLNYKMPIRGILSQYFALCEEYKEKYGKEYTPINEMGSKSDKLKQIEELFDDIGIPTYRQPVVNCSVRIGDNNRIKNTAINIIVEPGKDFFY